MFAGELADIAVQVPLDDVVVDAMKCTLERCPEGFYVVCISKMTQRSGHRALPAAVIHPDVSVFRDDGFEPLGQCN